jgi:DNA primase
VAGSWIDIDAIKQQVTLQMIFDHYGLTGTRKGGEVRMICPFHDDTHPSLCANVEKGIWQCFGCGRTGDAITFVMQRNRIDTGDRTADRLAAARSLAQTFGIATLQPPRSNTSRRQRLPGRPPPVQETGPARAQHDAEVSTGVMVHAGDAAPTTGRVNPPLAFTLRQLDTRHPYLLHDRSLRPETIDHFGLGFYSEKGVMSGRVVIPIRDETGQLIAYAGRWPGPPPEGEPKYRFPLNFRKSLAVFNLHRARDHASDGLVVVEGFFSVFDLWQKGRQNVVAVMGCTLSLEQKRLLVQTVGQGGRVLLAFDADPAGLRGMRDAVERLVSHVFVRAIELTEKGGLLTQSKTQGDHNITTASTR